VPVLELKSTERVPLVVCILLALRAVHGPVDAVADLYNIILNDAAFVLVKVNLIYGAVVFPSPSAVIALTFGVTAAVADPVVDPVPLNASVLLDVTVTVELAPADNPVTVKGYDVPDAVPGVTVALFEAAKE
jgi:hypothetical protein